MTDSFKACPFCGTENVQIHFIRGHVLVGCTTDECIGNWYYARPYNEKQMAFEAWNSRVDEKTVTNSEILQRLHKLEDDGK